MKKKSKILLSLSIVASALSSVAFCRYYQFVSIENDSPRLICLENFAKVESSDLIDSDQFDLSILKLEPFQFIGNGQQSVAFESFDQRYVLKFFLKKPISKKMKERNKVVSFFKSFKSREKFSQKKLIQKKRQDAIFRNYSSIFVRAPDIAGILSLHLLPKNISLPKVQLLGPKKEQFVIDLSEFAFVLQKKALLVKETLAQVNSNQDKLALLDQMRLFLKKRAELGYTDLRRTMSMDMNYGFQDDSPIQFDIGNVIFKEEILKNPKQEVEEITALFDRWINQNLDYLGLVSY